MLQNIKIPLLIVQLIYFCKSSQSYSNTATIALVQLMVIGSIYVQYNAVILNLKKGCLP